MNELFVFFIIMIIISGILGIIGIIKIFFETESSKQSEECSYECLPEDLQTEPIIVDLETKFLFEKEKKHLENEFNEEQKKLKIIDCIEENDKINFWILKLEDESFMEIELNIDYDCPEFLDSEKFGVCAPLTNLYIRKIKFGEFYFGEFFKKESETKSIFYLRSNIIREREALRNNK